MVKHRIHYLGIEDYYPKSSDKCIDYEDFKQKYSLEDAEIITMGDDLPDMGILQRSGIATCPPNAVQEVKAIVDYISPISGGKGAVRDVIEQVLKIQGKWEIDETRSV